MHTSFLTAAITALILTASATTPAAAIDTIDCQRDQNPAERTICSSQRLQVLDAKVTEAYADIMLDGGIKARTKEALYISQLVFLNRRDACGRDVRCLAEVMEHRASHINLYR